MTDDETTEMELEIFCGQLQAAARNIYLAGYKAGTEAAARKCENAAEHFGTIYARIIRATDA